MRGTILNALRCSIFTGGVVTENGSCSAAFCESAALRGYPLRLTTFASSPKGTPYGNVGNFATTTEAVPLGKVASPQAMTEGVLPGKQAFHFSRKLYHHTKKLPLRGSWRTNVSLRGFNPQTAPQRSLRRPLPHRQRPVWSCPLRLWSWCRSRCRPSAG